MSEINIENLEDLIAEYVGSNKKIVERKLTNLTAPGENYWSSMVKVDLVLKNQATGEEEDLHAVAKCMLKPSDDDLRPQKMSLLNFENELAFYKEILPTLKAFQREHGMLETNIFPELYAARYNLHQSNKSEVDEYAVLIFENLISQGYSNGDRHLGFDLEQAKFILKDLAEFHAIPLALKIKKPYVFEQKILANIKKPEFGPPGGPPSNTPSKPPGELPTDFPNQPPGGIPNGPPGVKPDGPPPGPSMDIWINILEKYEACKPYLGALKKKIDKGNLNPFDNPTKEGPFHTISHQDMWVNNTMQCYDNGKVIRNKLIDFQMYSYDTPIRDLLFFLFTSVKMSVLKTYLDDLIKHYHTHFVKVLIDLDCDTTPYNYYKFLVEIDSKAINEFPHIMFLCVVVFGNKNELALDMVEGRLKLNISERAKERVAYTLTEFGKRGWIA